MNNLNLIIARNLKAIRDDKRLCLDRVAELTGVSKSMLGQIERGESNPTISTVWKIATGLKISFSSLLNVPQIDTLFISGSELEPLIEDNGRYRLYPFFPYSSDRQFEVYAVEIDDGGFLSADAHGDGTQEFITVFDGELTIRVGDEEYTVKPGDAIKFRADVPHVYHNFSNATTRLSMVIYYPDHK